VHWKIGKEGTIVYAWKFFLSKKCFLSALHRQEFSEHVGYQHVIAIAMVLNQAFFKPIYLPIPALRTYIVKVF
jgi:hypothetical protein